MDTDTRQTKYTRSELMVTAAAREIKDHETVFVGMRLPLLGFFLAKSTHAPNATGVYELGIVRSDIAREPILTMGDLPNLQRAQWLSDTGDIMGLLQRGEVDVSFIGGAQVDRFGNLNTTLVGSKDRTETRLPGSGGACDLACLGKRHIIIMAHETHRFVPKVDYITSPGYGDGPGWRNRSGLSYGGPAKVITTLGVFGFHPDTMEMTTETLHPGVTPDMVKLNTGWDLSFPETVAVTPEPTGEELKKLRRLDPDGYWTRN